MTTQGEKRLQKVLETIAKRSIRIDIKSGHLDRYFMTLFMLYWIVSESVTNRVGNRVVIDLIQAGLRTKWKEGGLIRDKVTVYCQSIGISEEQLLEAVEKFVGDCASAENEVERSGSGVNVEDIRGFNINLGEK